MLPDHVYQAACQIFKARHGGEQKWKKMAICSVKQAMLG